MRDTIDMAREVYGKHTEWTGAPLDRLEQFVALVRADEREACAKLCDELANDENTDEYINGADWCSVRIRARGTT